MSLVWCMYLFRPDVSGPLRAEQAAVLLHSEDNEHKEEFISDLPQQVLCNLE